MSLGKPAREGYSSLDREIQSRDPLSKEKKKIWIIKFTLMWRILI
jgi:hypothetical protein